MTKNKSNFAFPLAIAGTHDQLKLMVEKLISLGYQWRRNDPYWDNNCSDIATCFDNVIGKLGWETEKIHIATNFDNVIGKLGLVHFFHAGYNDRHVISLSNDSEACILALAAARADGVYCDGEWAWNIDENELQKCVGLIGMMPEQNECFRRPTFEEIVNHFAAKEQPVAEPAPQPTLLDRIKSGEVKKVVSDKWGVSEIINTKGTNTYPIQVLFPYEYQWKTYTEHGAYDINTSVSKFNIRPYVEEKPFLMESNPTGEDAKTYYEAAKLTEATLQAEIDRMKKEMADMLVTQQQAANNWAERESALVGTINELCDECAQLHASFQNANLESEKLKKEMFAMLTIQFIEKEVLPGLPLTTVNDGITNEQLLEVLIDRVSFLNAKFPCKENACCITHMQEALMWLEKRTTKGLTFMLCIGNNGGLYARCSKRYWRICLWRIAFTLYFTDFEAEVRNAILGSKNNGI